jgi:hypothetical protein
MPAALSGLRQPYPAPVARDTPRKRWYERPRFVEWGSPAPFLALTLAAVGIALLADGKSGGLVPLGIAVAVYGLYRFAKYRGDDDRHGFY